MATPTKTKCKCPENYPQERTCDFGDYANYIARVMGVKAPVYRVRVHTGDCMIHDEPLAKAST
jgi:hypothetical protein